MHSRKTGATTCEAPAKQTACHWKRLPRLHLLSERRDAAQHPLHDCVIGLEWQDACLKDLKDLKDLKASNCVQKAC